MPPRLTRFEHPTPVSLTEPPLPRGKDFDGHRFIGLHYRRYEGDLFAGRISGYEIGQGDLGDCYFLSSLAAVANGHSRLIRRGIVANDDGTYTVTFWERKRGVASPVRIRVDTRFPVDRRGHQKFGRSLRSSSRGQVLWPALFEKAFAAWQQGYVHVNQGGDGGFALTALTGTPSRTLTPNKRSRLALWQRLVEGIAAGHPMVTSTPSTRDLARRTGRADLAGLIDDHYYAIAGAVTRRGERLVKLYSPLVDVGLAAVSTPTRRDNARRHTVVSLDDYRRDFDQLVVCALGNR